MTTEIRWSPEALKALLDRLAPDERRVLTLLYRLPLFRFGI